MRLLRELREFREAQRESLINAGCRLDELRTIKLYGTPEDHLNYTAASNAWLEAGSPSVPFITEWYAKIGES